MRQQARCSTHRCTGDSRLKSVPAPGRILARKRPLEVDVRFAIQPAEIHTREGVVQAHAGDAIVTGGAGEHWRVSRAHFGKNTAPFPHPGW